MKRKIAYVIGLAFVVMVLSGTVFAEEEVSTIACDNGVVNIGDMNADVQDKCGQPDSQGMNEWVYHFGPDLPVYTVIFKEGQVVRILEDMSGN